MQFTPDHWREATGPMAHQLTVIDTAVAMIANGEVKIALVLRVRHADTGDTFDQLVELAPEVNHELCKQLIEMEVVAGGEVTRRSRG